MLPFPGGYIKLNCVHMLEENWNACSCAWQVQQMLYVHLSIALPESGLGSLGRHVQLHYMQLLGASPMEGSQV